MQPSTLVVPEQELTSNKEPGTEAGDIEIAEPGEQQEMDREQVALDRGV